MQSSTMMDTGQAAGGGVSNKSTARRAGLPRNSLGLVCLNAGCGRHYLRDWVNLDFRRSRYVRYCDLRRRIPYPDNTFDLVYSSHVIEHFPPGTGQAFIREAFRVLVPGGTLRLLTPDLERMVQEYLANLRAWNEERSEVNRRRYEWIVLEMFDQMTREKSGGLMLEKIRAKDVSPEYVIERTGDELRGQLFPGESPPEGANDSPVSAVFYRLPASCQRVLRRLHSVWSNDLKLPFKKPFSESGELHRWCYDRVSLEHLLDRAGFVDFRVVDYRTSRVPGWEKMNLDTSDHGDAPRKPESITVEASKPGAKR